MKNNVASRLVWMKGEIVNVNDAKVNVLSPTSQFGLNVFEGIRCYWNESQEQLFAFRLKDHFLRLKRSLKLLQMEDKYSVEEMEKAMIDVIVANEYTEDIAVRQTLFVDGFGSWPSKGPVEMFISPIPKAKTSAENNKKGLNCCISTWRRINDISLSPRIKCGANYINSRMAQLEALNDGYDTTIFLNDVGKVAEGPGSCLFLIRNGMLVTPMITDSVLESITRDTIITIAKRMGISIQERTVDRTELYICEEAFLCGSAMEITPIFFVDKYKVGNGEQGEVTKILHKEYLKTVTGENNKYQNWLTPIYK